MAKRKLTDPFIKNYPNPDKREEIYDDNERSPSGLALRVTTTGHKSFVYRYRFSKKVKRYTIGKYPVVGLAQARDEARDLEYKVTSGIDPLEEKKSKKHQPDPQTFKELAEEFKDKYIPTLRDKTQAEYRRIIDNELIPAFGKESIKGVSRNQIISFLDKKAIKEGSPTMANRIRARLSTIYNFGIERGLAGANPVQGISKRSEGETRRERFYNEDEVTALWEAFDQQSEPVRSIMKLLLICGQRKGETSRMRWSDIRGDVWTIPASDAKGKRPHDVPLPPLALEIIEGMKPVSGESEYVFESPALKGEPIGWIQRPVKDIRNLSGVPDFRAHDLRRTVATYMAKLGIDRTALGKVLNHKGLSGDSQVTAIYDRHSYMKEKRQALNLWDDHLRKILAGETEAKIFKMGQ